MANPAVLQTDTVLYCPAEPEGRLFPAGSEWPGDAWSSDRGGEPVGKKTTAQAAKDLIEAQNKLDALSAQMDRQTHSLAEATAQRDEANGKVADLEQRAIAAEKGQQAAQDAATNYMKERDQARSDHQTVSDQFVKARADLEAAQADAAKVPGLVADLETANQTIADLNGKLAAATKPAKAGKAQGVPDDTAAAPADAAKAPDAT